MEGFGSRNKKSKNLKIISKEQYINKAIKLHSQGNIELASKYYQYCIDNDINDQRVFCNLSIILRDSGKLKDAEIILRKLISIDPFNINAYNNLSGILRELGKRSDAEVFLRKSLDIDPNNFNSLYNLGCLLIDQKKYKDAVLIFEKSISINLSNSNAYLNLGIAKRNLGELKEASRIIKKAIEIKPNNALGFLNLGIVYKKLKEYKLAIDFYSKALTLNKEFLAIKYELFLCKGEICDWNDFKDLHTSIINAGLSGDSVNPMAFFLYEDNPLRTLQRSKNFFYQNHKRRQLKINFAKKQKIRIGYFSADFHCNHALMNSFPSVVLNHDLTKFEIYIYSFTFEKDRCTEIYKNSSSVFRDIINLNEVEALRVIRDDNLDIAVDLMGYTKKSRTYIFSNRVAPIQINYLGYPGTMGSKTYDYILSDEIIIPKKFEKFYTEKILRLSHFFPPNFRANEEISLEHVCREQFELPNNAFVFTCFNHNRKITQKEFDIWMRLLNQIEDSVLWLQKSNDFSDINLKKEAEKRNVKPERIIFARKLKSPKIHLARYSLGDLGLDTFCYNGHTTTSDALSLGLPVLTKIGKNFSARVSASILNSIGMNELVTNNEKEYEEKALYYARNRVELKKIKNFLNSIKKDSSLSNSKEYTIDLEKTYSELVSKIDQ